MDHKDLHDITSIFEYYSNNLIKTDIGYRFSDTNIWDEITTSLHRSLYISNLLNNSNYLLNKPIQFPIQENPGSYVDVNEDVLGKKVIDVIKITFESLYPNTIINLCEESILPIQKETSVFYILFKNKLIINNNLSEDGRKCLKLYINYFYGKLDPNHREMVTGRAYTILSKFSKSSKYDDSWIYSDTDEVYLKDKLGLINQIKNDIDLINIPYKIEYLKEVLILGKKRLVTIDSNSIGSIKGVKIFKK